jgi:putative PIN family toxin of toxin-antitoxin system
VIDTNTVLRAVVSEFSAAAKILRAAENRSFVPLLSRPVLDEYWTVLSDPIILRKFPRLDLELVKTLMRDLRYVSDYVRSCDAEFSYPRDQRDAKFIELAISLKATHILSYDNDLLSLPTSRTEAGRRFRQRLPETAVLDAGEFLKRYEVELGIP